MLRGSLRSGEGRGRSSARLEGRDGLNWLGAAVAMSTAVPTAVASAWERAAGERTVLALPPDAGAVVSPASIPYAIEVCSVAGMPPTDEESPAPTFSARVSLYDRGTKSIFGRTWTSGELPWPHLNEPNRKADLEIAQTVALHTTVVGHSCQVVVEIVRGEISVGWAMAPLFPPHGAGRLRDTFGPEVEAPVFAGTPRYLLFDDQPPAEQGLPDCHLRLRVRTFTDMTPFQGLLRENEIVGINEGVAGLGGSFAAPTKVPTCTIKLADLTFAIPGVPETQDLRTSTDISKQDFNAAMMKYLEAVTPAEIWANSKGMTKARALVGVHNGHCYIAPRVSVPLTKTEGLAGGYSLDADEAAELTDVPLDAGIAVIISLQMTLDTPGAGAGAATTTLLIGWITTCPCDGGAAPPSASECVGLLSRGPQPAPDGCLAVSWGDLEVEEEVRFVADGVELLLHSV